MSMTIPSALASAASTGRPVYMISLARCMPIMRGSVKRTPQSGMTPIRQNTEQKRARGVHKMKSAHRARPKPPP
jgi:hypothetical protein